MPRKGYESLTLKENLVEKIDGFVDDSIVGMRTRAEVIESGVDLIEKKKVKSK